MRGVKRFLWWILASSTGGFNRARILREVMITPRNANELATLLNLDYKTTRHHIGVLEENHLLSSIGSGYGKVYHPSPLCEENINLFNEIWEELIKRGKK